MEILGLSIGQVATILSLILTVAASILGPKYVKMKKLVVTIINSIEDDNLTKEELKNIVKAIKNL